jgi:prophage regulatory protein
MLKTAQGDIIGTLGPCPRFMRRRQVEAVTGLPCSTLYDYIAQDRFPKPAAKISSRVVVWLESEVLEWMRARVAETRGEAS